MKQKYFLEIAVVLLFLISGNNSFGQVNLNPGDIVLLQYNSDGGSDELVFLPLVNIPGNSVIYFSDGSWNSMTSDWGLATERGIKYTVASGGITAGTLIKLLNPTGALYELSPSTLGSLEFYEVDGSVETGSSRELTLSTSGDQVLVFQTSDGVITSTKTFIYGFNVRSATGYTDGWQSNGNALSSSSTDSHLPPGLTALNSTQSNKVSATAFGIASLNGAHRDNWQYTGLFTATDRAGWLTRIHTLTNWSDDDTNVYSHSVIASGNASVTVNGSTFTWDGSSNNDWATAANWDTNSIPSSIDNVIIPSGLTNYPTASAAVSINSLTIASGASLKATSTFTVSSATFNRNLANGSQWYLISSPITGETFDSTWATANSIPTSSLDTDNIGISWYDNTTADVDEDDGGSDTATGHWRYLQSNNSNSGTFSTGVGYGVIRSSSGLISFTGTGINTSSQTTTVTYGASNPNNYNLVGNPFTSYLNLGNFFTSNNTANLISGTVWFWNGSSYDAKMSGIVDDTNFNIAPGQGFFIEAGTAATSSNNISFNISGTDHNSTDTFQKTSNIETSIFLNIDDGSNQRYAKLYYIDSATKGFDNGFDGKLFGGVSHNFAIYSDLIKSDGKKYQVQSLPNSDYENMIIPIGLIAKSGKQITFTSETLNLPTGLKVYLEDRQSNTFTRLDETNSKYTINLKEGLNGTGRFYLHTTQSVLTIDDSQLLNSVSIFKANETTLRITGLPQGKATIALFNTLGKQVLSTSFMSNTTNEIALPKLSSGVYFAKLQTETGKLTKKIILE